MKTCKWAKNNPLKKYIFQSKEKGKVLNKYSLKQFWTKTKQINDYIL